MPICPDFLQESIVSPQRLARVRAMLYPHSTDRRAAERTALWQQWSRRLPDNPYPPVGRSSKIKSRAALKFPANRAG
jgi:hypothetical protein